MLLAIVDHGLHREDELWLDLGKPVQDTLKVRDKSSEITPKENPLSASGASDPSICSQYKKPIKNW
jgi:hypothetical protein